jgi:hypothetical protein
LTLVAGIAIGSTISYALSAMEIHHPEMHAGMQNLGFAEQALQHATHDYGGHREKAMHLIHDAKEEIKAGLACAKDL